VTFNNGLVVAGATYYLPPSWTGDFREGSDIALVGLSTQVVTITGYDLWRGSDPFGAIVDVAGWGRSGYGATGSEDGTAGILRAGQNRLDPASFPIPGNPYAFDFDSGLAENDALCLWFGACDAGIGESEVMPAPGDSGGPSLYEGRLAGIHSFLYSRGPAGGDIDGELNSSFGELWGDTRVTGYASWIDTFLIPEPGVAVLVATGLVAVMFASRRRDRRSCGL
jgi:hypothetical protein